MSKKKKTAKVTCRQCMCPRSKGVHTCAKSEGAKRARRMVHISRTELAAALNGRAIQAEQRAKQEADGSPEYSFYMGKAEAFAEVTGAVTGGNSEKRILRYLRVGGVERDAAKKALKKLRKMRDGFKQGSAEWRALDAAYTAMLSSRG